MGIKKLVFFLSIILTVASLQHGNVTTSLLKLANSWATSLGAELSSSGKHITRVSQIIESFKDASLQKRDDEKITADITRNIKIMMNEKINAVRRIMDAAENTAMSSHDEIVENFEYYNAKCLTTHEDPCTNDSLKAGLQSNPHFWNLAVNTSFSAVHVPTNVYDKAPDVIKAIKWSENLNDIFKNNFQMDPSLSWQYFGSSTGFMRQFPAIQWKQEPVDLYDCRTRSWFIEAATSPKDLVILVDHSGSMTGIRREIARHVVNNILDTLGNNDFVNILSFSEETTEIEPCFKDILVQANLANIRTFKEKMENITTVNIANFSFALNKAFQLLEKYRHNETDDHSGAQCNQAIMLITDGVHYNFKEIFQEFNWPNMPVRVFTYLVGREVAEVREIKWMACANRGYYVHLSTLAEVREQVLQYIPVMARPLVLNRTTHPIIWTPVYADVTDPKMTDWLWQKMEHADQKKKVLEARKNKKIRKEEQDRKFITSYRKGNIEKQGMHQYKLMTSVSMPVFDRRENATRIANLLGVAGTDVPISEIQKLMNPFKLGVNAYAFIVTNNGYILYHPDLRPVYEGILKPNYNSIDIAEIELVDDGYGPREFNKDLLDMRLEIIEQEKNGSKSLTVKYHYDDMKRVGHHKRKYYYSPIQDSPFTVVVAIPEDYGKYRVHGEVELHRAHQNEKAVLELFHGKNWRVHPNWEYCKYCNDTYIRFESPEEELFHFLNRSNQPGWKWKEKPKIFPDSHFYNNSALKLDKSGKDSYYCDRDLIQSVVFDARATKSFTEEHKKDTKIRSEDFLGVDKTEREKDLICYPCSCVYSSTCAVSTPVTTVGKHKNLHCGINTLVIKLSEMNSLNTGMLPSWDEDFSLFSIKPYFFIFARFREEFKKKFGITTAFVATSSGLTRWRDFEPTDRKDHTPFGDIYNKAIDEVWYKRAVEQYFVNNESFVYSVPFEEYNENTLVTASRAVFHHDKQGMKAPAAVVGYQFHHDALFNLFFNIVSACPPDDCDDSKICSSDDLDCFVLDNNGYIVLSENSHNTGRFFGEIHGTVMDLLVEERIYNRIPIYDYQALCFPFLNSDSAGSILNTPIQLLLWMGKWFLGKLLWIMSELEYSYTEYIRETTFHTEEREPEVYKVKLFNKGAAVMLNVTDGMEVPKVEKETEFVRKRRPESCDQEVNLYLLQSNNANYSKDADGALRPFVVVPVQHTNLILVVVHTLYLVNETSFKNEPQEIEYRDSVICHKIISNNLPRKRPKDCINRHEKEGQIELCGLGNRMRQNWYLIKAALLLTMRHLI